MSNNPKHKKIITDSLDASELAKTLTMLTESIASLDKKQQSLLNDWLNIWSKYLTLENNFDSKRLVYYKRGDIVLANFGYNVGSEFGGSHYAVVVENNNNIANTLVTVVPISSLEAEKSKDDLHKTEVFLGKIIGSDIECFAMPIQIRPISKLRIIKPKHKSDGKFKLSGELLDKIDEQIKLIFTKPQNMPLT